MAIADRFIGPSVSLFGLYVCGLAAVGFLVRPAASGGVCALASVACFGPDLVTSKADLVVQGTNCALGIGTLFGITMAASWLRTRQGELRSALEDRTAELEVELLDRKALEIEALEAGQRERRRIAHQLHDALGGNLAGASFRLKSVMQDLNASGLPGVRDCREILAQVNDALSQARCFARVLDPVEITGPRLQESLARLAQDVSKAFAVDCKIGLSPLLPTLPDPLAQHLYFVILEASRNAVQHAAAQKIRVRLRTVGNELELTVQNDGRSWQGSPSPDAGMGLRVMRHRMVSLGGDLEIEAAAGSDTLVRCRAPIA